MVSFIYVPSLVYVLPKRAHIYVPSLDLGNKGVWASQVALVIKNLPASARDLRNAGLTPGLGRSPEGMATHSAPVFLPGESHGQRSLEGYSPQHGKKSNRTE